MYGTAVLQLFSQLSGHNFQIIGINNRRHPVAHSGKFLPGIAQELKKTVIRFNDGKEFVKPAAEHRTRNIIIDVQKFLMASSCI